ncbi:Ett1 protein [Martiniozyma asiatica (nom. inval.)]|nr:Ett1 protein [Martiniozyma asiatica]
MAKRKIGLGHKSKEGVKKVKVEKPIEQPAEEQVEPEGTNIADIESLYRTWDGDETILNGIINECSRLESAGNSDSDEVKCLLVFAIIDMSSFKAEEREDWLHMAKEKIEEIDGKVWKSLSQCKLILNELSVDWVNNLDVDGNFIGKEMEGSVIELLKAFKKKFNLVLKNVEKDKVVGPLFIKVLDGFDALLNLIDNFGVVDEGDEVDSDAEEEEGIELDQNHPLFEIKQSDEFDNYWREAMEKYGALIDDVEESDLVNVTSIDGKDVETDVDVLLDLKRDVHKKIGQSYLMESESPLAFYTSYAFAEGGEEEEDEEEEDAPTDEELPHEVKEARDDAKRLILTAIEHLKSYQSQEDPQSWVDLAEAEISYGNLLTVDSKEQEEWYKKAEIKLRRANDVGHGKWQDILTSLLGKE